MSMADGARFLFFILFLHASSSSSQFLISVSQALQTRLADMLQYDH